MELGLAKRECAMRGVLHKFPFIVTWLILLLIAPSTHSHRSGLLVSLDVATNVSSELSALLAKELAVEDPVEVFSSPIFRDLSLPARSLNFFVRALSSASFSEERIALREKAPNLELLVRLMRSEAPLLFPTLLWVHTKMVDDIGNYSVLDDHNRISFSKLLQTVCSYDRRVNFWPTPDDLGTAYSENINLLIHSRMESFRAYLCGLKPNLFKTELKKFRRYVLFKVNKELKDVPPSLNNFLVETSSFVESANNFLVHFEEMANRRNGWPLLKRILQPEMDYKLFPVFSDMLNLESPKSMSRIVLSFLLSYLTEFSDPKSEMKHLISVLVAAKECNTDANKWKSYAVWPWIIKRAVFGFNSTCPQGNDSVVLIRSLTDILLHGLAKESPEILRFLLQMAPFKVYTSGMFPRSSLFPLSLLLGDDFSAYEFLLFIHSPRQYLELSHQPSLWAKVICSPMIINETFKLLPETNLKFLSSYMCQHLRRNPNRISVFDLFNGDKFASAGSNNLTSLNDVEALRERLENEVSLLNKNVLHRLLVDTIRRTEQVYGKMNSIPLLLRWILRLLGDKMLFYTGPQYLMTAVVKDSIHVSWKAPMYANPEWNRYFVTWFQASTGSFGKFDMSEYQINATLKAILPGDKYDICISMGATNGTSLSPSACSSVLIRPAKPRDFQVSAVAPAHKLILLKWQPPPGVFRTFLMHVQIVTNISKRYVERIFPMGQSMAVFSYEPHERLSFHLVSSIREASTSPPFTDLLSNSVVVSTSFSGKYDIPDAGNIIQGSSYITDMSYVGKINLTLSWRLRVPELNGTSSVRPVGFVVYQRPAIGPPRIVDVVPNVFNYSAFVQKPATICKMVLLLAPLLRDLNSPSETFFHETYLLTVDQCPSNWTSTEATDTTVAPTPTPSLTTNRVFTFPFYGFNVSLPLLSPLPKAFLSDRGVMNIFHPWLARLKVRLKESFNFTPVGYPNEVVDVFVRLPLAQISRYRRSARTSRNPTAIVDASIVFTDRPPATVFLHRIQSIAATLEPNRTVNSSVDPDIEFGSLSMTAGLKSQLVPPVGSIKSMLGFFCFLSRFYYAACISKQKCSGVSTSGIVLPGDGGFVGRDNGDNNVAIVDLPFDREDGICLCQELPTCVTKSPNKPISPDIGKWETLVLSLAIFVPLGISGSCILLLAIMAYFVGRRKRHSHKKFMELAMRRRRFMEWKRPDEVFSPDTSDVAILTENDMASEPTPVLLSHPADAYVNPAYVHSPELGRSKSLANRVGDVGNRTSAFFPVLSRQSRRSVGAEETDVNAGPSTPPFPPTSPSPATPLTFPSGMKAVQDKGFYVMRHESAIGSTGSQRSHGGAARERGVEDHSLNSWRTTWEPDTLLATPERELKLEDAGVAFPSAISAMNDLTPTTPGDVEFVLESLASSRTRLDSPPSAVNSRLHLDCSSVSVDNEAVVFGNATDPSWLPESWRDVLPQSTPNLPESWRDVPRTSL